jgi:hypothetical protein
MKNIGNPNYRSCIEAQHHGRYTYTEVEQGHALPTGNKLQSGSTVQHRHDCDLQIEWWWREGQEIIPGAKKE